MMNLDGPFKEFFTIAEFVFLLVTTGITVLLCAGIYWLMVHPAAIGEFFGHIVSGFNGAVK